MGYVASAEVDGSGLAGPVALVGEVPTMQCLLSDPPARVGLSSWGPQTLGPSGSYIHSFPMSSDQVPTPKRERFPGMLNHQGLAASWAGPWRAIWSSPTLSCRKGRLGAGPPWADMQGWAVVLRLELGLPFVSTPKPQG